MATSDIWCQNPKCVQRKTNAQIRGSKGNKYYQSFKAQDYLGYWCSHACRKEWYDLIFGIPHEDVSNGTSRQHRLTKSQIDSHLNDIAVKWFNDNKLEIFDIIVRRGLYNTPIDYQIWHHKPTDGIEIHSIDELEKLVYNGNWVMNETTLWFIDSNGKKLFHLQMKGSGKKYVSGYHAMMFHIYKTL